MDPPMVALSVKRELPMDLMLSLRMSGISVPWFLRMLPKVTVDPTSIILSFLATFLSSSILLRYTISESVFLEG